MCDDMTANPYRFWLPQYTVLWIPPSLSYCQARPSLASRPPKVILYDLTNWFRVQDLYTTNILSVRYPFI